MRSQPPPTDRLPCSANTLAFQHRRCSAMSSIIYIVGLVVVVVAVLSFFGLR